MTEAPRDNLTRSVPFHVERADENGDGLTLSGYAAVFDAPTQIDSYEGRFTETIARGAFRKTISERTPVLMFNHGRHAQIGDIPIGKITTLREDERGLYVEARLAKNSLVEPVREAIAMGAIDGMSFRFGVVKEKWSEDGTQRTLQELRLAELGPVVFPAYAATTVGVRSIEQTAPVIQIPVEELARALVATPDSLRAFSAALMAQGFEPVVRDHSENTEEALNEAGHGEQATSGEPLAEPTPARSTKRERLKAVAQLKGYIPNADQPA